MWKIIPQKESDYKIQKYRPSSDKELEESPNLKWRKIIPIVSVLFQHETGQYEFKASAYISRQRERVGGVTRIVSEKWLFAIQTPYKVQARGTESGPWGRERFLEKLTARCGAEFAQKVLELLDRGISEAEEDRSPPAEIRQVQAPQVSADAQAKWLEIKARLRRG